VTVPAADGAWQLVDGPGPTWIRSQALAAVPGIAHAFSTRRHDANLDFDVGGPDEVEPAASARIELARAAGLGAAPPLVLRQTHGSTLVQARADSAGAPADGAWAVRGASSVPAAVRTADCVPILIAERSGRAVAAVHAGWRGTAAGIAALAVSRLAELGFDPATLVVALGPAIGPCCYEVGVDVLERVASGAGVAPPAVAGRGARGGRTVDLHAALAAQLRRAAVSDDAIHRAPWCTACRADLFFSHRRDRGRAGRHMACIGFVGPS
jgi:YfiH family protein